MQAPCLGGRSGTAHDQVVDIIAALFLDGLWHGKCKSKNTSPHNDVHAEIRTQAKTPRHHMVIGAFFYSKERGGFLEVR